MRFPVLRALSVAVLALSFPALTHAQRPTPAQAQELLRTRPDLLAQLRKRILDTGLSPDQVRARLKAEGYPENLLDQYLPGATGTPDPKNSEAAASALKSLGIVDSLDLTPTGLDASDTNGPPLPTGDAARDADAALKLRPKTVADSVAMLRSLLRAQEREDDGRRIFGLDLFTGNAAQFQPNLAGPVDANYQLGPGDKLVLILTGDVELSYDLDVTREGFIVIPQVGQINVANLTLRQLEDVLFTRLARSYSGVRRSGATTRFSISVARLRSLQVFVIGDVEHPGSYRVSSAGSAFNALYAAGGPTKSGSLRNIQIKRGGKLVEQFDGYDYLLRGDASKDVRLQNGDVVFVPTHGPRARIVGEVLRPATYEVRTGETIRDVIAFAGGFSAQAEQRRLTVDRVLPAAERTAAGDDRIVVNVTGDNGAATVPVRDGDVVRVPTIADRIRSRIVVKGNVWTPGDVGARPDLTLSRAIALAGGLKPDTYLGQILITRLRADSTRVQLRTAFADTTGRVVNDFAVQGDDEIQVFSLTDFRAQRYVSIAGAVKKGGRFPFHEGMTLRDLVLLGGGLEQGAFLQEAEIARLPENRLNGATAVSLRVPLDSTYLFERTSQTRYQGPPGIAAAPSGSPESPLQPYDNVLIFRQPDWELQRLVWLTGEVKFPGRYALLKRDEKLSELVARAGGLARESYAEGAYFFRSRENIGRVALDLRRALREANDLDNVTLVDGDSLHVPRYNGVVAVKGRVNSPAAVALREGANIGFYVRSAGGYGKGGDAGRAYVVQPNGLVETIRPWPWWIPLPARQPTPRGGSQVIVPEKDLTDAAQAQQTLSQILSVVGVLSPIIAILVARQL